MPAMFETGFFVREPAWHGLGTVLNDYPATREEAYLLAGHDYRIVRHNAGIEGLVPLTQEKRNELIQRGVPVVGPLEGNWFSYRPSPEHTGFVIDHTRADGTRGPLHGNQCSIAASTYQEIQNETAYDIAELLFDQGFEWETGITLSGGSVCALTLKLNEPIQIPGDDSPILPYGCLSWSHDGSGALRIRTGSIRQVCANTVAASEAEGKALGTDFTFRHTKNVGDRIAEAKKAVSGARHAITAYQELAVELSAMHVNPTVRDMFISTIIGDEKGILSLSPTTSDRVKSNIETERAKVNSLFFGPTIPDAHRDTGYGLFLAGGEYFDHLRNFRSQESYVKRTLLSDNPAKAALAGTIRELVTA